MTESDLTALLSTRHSDDVFFAQVKNGPTYTASKLLVLDGWAMKKSYSQPCITAYEIKVSRSDFARDTKWTLAMPLCNRFYWVCPTGLIQPDEVPKETGLLWASKHGKKLVTKKLAPHHEHDELSVARLVTYLLYSRTQERRYDGAEFWRNWLKQKDERKELGAACSKKLRELAREASNKSRLSDNHLSTMEYWRTVMRKLHEAGLVKFCDSELPHINLLGEAKAAMDLPKLIPNIQVQLQRTAREVVELRRYMENISDMIRDCTERISHEH